jgi:hypothetical protein
MKETVDRASWRRRSRFLYPALDSDGLFLVAEAALSSPLLTIARSVQTGFAEHGLGPLWDQRVRDEQHDGIDAKRD